MFKSRFHRRVLQVPAPSPRVLHAVRSTPSSRPPAPVQTTLPGNANGSTAAVDTSAGSQDTFEPWTYVDHFRFNLAGRFPFVDMPDCKASVMIRERPCVSKAAVLAAANMNVAQCTRLEAEFMQDLHESHLLRGERSLDLLQGILIYLAWYHFHYLVARQSTVMLHIATALVADLGLNQPPRRTEPFERQVGAGDTEEESHQEETLNCSRLCRVLVFIICYSRLQ